MNVEPGPTLVLTTWSTKPLPFALVDKHKFQYIYSEVKPSKTSNFCDSQQFKLQLHTHGVDMGHVGARGVSMEIDSSGGSASSAALKSHTFCVPHNGIETLSEGLGTFGVNKGVSKTFTLQFIGEGSVSVALRNQGRFNHVVGIDVELCLQWLAYQKAAGYPDIVPGKLFDIRHSSKM